MVPVCCPQLLYQTPAMLLASLQATAMHGHSQHNCRATAWGKLFAASSPGQCYGQPWQTRCQSSTLALLCVCNMSLGAGNPDNVQSGHWSPLQQLLHSSTSQSQYKNKNAIWRFMSLAKALWHAERPRKTSARQITT